MNVSEIKAKFKEAQNIMKKEGETLKDTHQQLPQLSWMLFLKCFDDFEKTNSLRIKGYDEILPEELRWRNWATKKKISGELNVKKVDELLEKFKNLEPEEGKEERNLFSTIFKKLPNRIRDDYRLRELLMIVNEFSFKQEELDTFAESYKDELFEMVSSSDNPYYYTPRAVARFIVTAINPDFKKHEQVYDPACGFGGFLIESLKLMEKVEKKIDTAESKKQLQHDTIFAVEKDVDTFVCGILNMMVNKIWKPNYSLDNSLIKHTRDFVDEDMHEIIITNPTHGGEEDKTVADNVPIEFKTTDTTLLFLYRTMIALKDNGRASMIVPNGFLFGTGVADRIKEKLLKEFNLHTIVKLAGTTFAPLADVDMNVLFFEKSGTTKEINYYQMHVPERVRGRGKDPKYGKTKPPEFEDFADVLEWIKSKKDDSNAWTVKVEDITSKDDSDKILHIDLDQKNPLDIEDTIDLSPHELIKQIIKDEKKTLELLTDVEDLINQEIPK
jgi:type I restriction enzyme M protein